MEAIRKSGPARYCKFDPDLERYRLLEDRWPTSKPFLVVDDPDRWTGVLYAKDVDRSMPKLRQEQYDGLRDGDPSELPVHLEYRPQL